MDSVTKTLKLMETNPGGVRFNDLQKVCEHYFGKPRKVAVATVYSKPHGLETQE